jgi:predicted PurR-regulated permease PerM
MNIQSYLISFAEFLSDVFLPFLIALAGFMFLWNVFRYFILGGANEESQRKAKTLALWGIGAFVLVLSLWGIVNLIVGGLNLGNTPITPDYLQAKGQSWGDNPPPDCAGRPVC